MDTQHQFLKQRSGWNATGREVDVVSLSVLAEISLLGMTASERFVVLWLQTRP